MRKLLTLVSVLAVLSSTPVSGAEAVSVDASPNPVTLGQRTRHTVLVVMSGRLDVWVSATGFERPGMGTLPPGVWSRECCPTQTAGTVAWRYRSSGAVPPGGYRFGATTRRLGSYLSTAMLGVASDKAWIQVASGKGSSTRPEP